MSAWEYKVVPAPTKGVKGRGIKGPEGRFANALEALMNAMGADGWEYQRAETLPSVERSGLTGSTTEWRNVLVFRRKTAAAMDDFEPELLPPPATDAPQVENTATEPEPPAPTAPLEAAPQTPDHDAEQDAPTKSGDSGDSAKGILDVTASIKNLSNRKSPAKSDY